MPKVILNKHAITKTVISRKWFYIVLWKVKRLFARYWRSYVLQNL